MRNYHSQTAHDAEPPLTKSTCLRAVAKAHALVGLPQVLAPSGRGRVQHTRYSVELPKVLNLRAGPICSTDRGATMIRPVFLMNSGRGPTYTEGILDRATSKSSPFGAGPDVTHPVGSGTTMSDRLSSGNGRVFYRSTRWSYPKPSFLRGGAETGISVATKVRPQYDG